MSCASNLSEICGSTNRILVYQDIAWINLTRAELASEIQNYETILTELKSDIQNWSTLLGKYYLSTTNAKVQRQSQELQTLVSNARQSILTLMPIYCMPLSIRPFQVNARNS